MPPLYINRAQYDTIQVDADAIARQMGFDGVCVIEDEELEQPTPPIEEWPEPTLDDHITISHDERN